jgi:magnesium chelatase subunit I
MDLKKIKTLGQLKATGYKAISIKDEVRANLIKKLKTKEPTFSGVYGYEDTVLPQVETALLSKHNMLFLGLRGQAKTRMARAMTNLLNEYVPVVAGSPLNDDPLHPISIYAKKIIAEKGDDTPIEWLHQSERYGEKLATPDVSVADLIGDIDPIKAANLKLSFSDEEVLHYGIIPRSNRCIFVINELPDLQARIQVALFNILEEGDIQIRGFKLRIPLDVLFVFTANPEDYTNRGSIVTPLKDRIQSQILTHYPKDIEIALQITEQEAKLDKGIASRIAIPDVVKRLVEQVAIEARNNELVDKKSGVSARLTIAALENAVNAADRRCIINDEPNSIVWMTDLMAIIPAITGKVELVYEGEQEGPYQVAIHLINKSIRTLFTQYFPNPDSFKKKRPTGKGFADTKEEKNPYKSITNWFDAGNQLHMAIDATDEERMLQLFKVDGLYNLVKTNYRTANDKEAALLMEFVLHGLASYSALSKTFVEGSIAFSDLMGSMLSNSFGIDDELYDE